MDAAHYTIFDTAIGRCGISWRSDRAVAFALPGSSSETMAAHLTRRHPDAMPGDPPPLIHDAIDATRRLIEGERADLAFIAVELVDSSDFERRVYEALREVGPGETVTYGELAERVGSPGAARAVGMAMARNPIPVIIPCHRVLASGGRSGGFSAPGGVTTKFRLLQIEQAGRSEAPLLFAELPLAVRKEAGK